MSYLALGMTVVTNTARNLFLAKVAHPKTHGILKRQDFQKSSQNLSYGFKSPLYTLFILGSYKTRKEIATMMGFGFLFMLALYVLPVILVVVIVGTLRVSNNK